MRRALAWVAVAPLVAGGVLIAHGIAYAVTGTTAGRAHHYLQHAPELLPVLALVALTAVALVQRMSRPAAWPFPVAAVLAFVLQEHLEQLAHTGRVPWLLTTQVFVVGLLLQAPVALGAWLLARWFLGVAEDAGRVRRPHLPGLELDLAPPVGVALLIRVSIGRSARGPPGLRSL